ncbi:MAG: hypothetical protein ACWA44_01815 [Thiotrichales bacterium]
MASVFFSTLSIHLRLKIPADTLASVVAASPNVVGEHMASALIDFERENRLGYFPAMDYLRGRNDFDPELINAVDGLAWVACQQVRTTTIKRLRPAFTQVEVDSIQSDVHLMPSARPRQPNAFLELAQHFTPDSVRIVLRASLLQKRTEREGLEGYARKMTSKWLSDYFETVEVIQVHKLEPGQHDN